LDLCRDCFGFLAHAPLPDLPSCFAPASLVCHRGEYDTERDDFLMFGYVVNKSTPIFSEWGYIPLNELEL
jgi:hypothetical protein